MLCLLLSATLVAQSPSAPAAPPPQTSAPAPAPDTAAEQAAYVIGPQDKLKIVVFEELALSNSFHVGADGTFDYPYIGRVIAAGKTTDQLEDEVTKRLADGYVRKPQVTVEIEQFRSRSVFIAGEVRNSTRMPLTGQMTLLEALVQAGWVSAGAGSQVLLTRNAASAGDPAPGTAPQGPAVLKISLADLQAGKPEANIFLQEGDSIFVPRAERFYVTGLVKTPGAYAHELGMTVQQALALAGGIADKGSNRGIKVKRRVNGKDVEVGVGLNDPVQPGDTIIIRQRLL